MSIYSAHLVYIEMKACENFHLTRSYDSLSTGKSRSNSHNVFLLLRNNKNACILHSNVMHILLPFIIIQMNKYIKVKIKDKYRQKEM